MMDIRSLMTFCISPQVLGANWSNKPHKTPHLEGTATLLYRLPIQSRSHTLLRSWGAYLPRLALIFSLVH